MSKEEKWEIAFSLASIHGTEPTDLIKKLAKQECKGEITTEDIRKIILNDNGMLND
ncbi:MAG: hypothetical protein RSE41_07465 [Clostridia bacterium]